MASTSRLIELFEPEFLFLGVCSNFGKGKFFCLVVLMLTGSDVGVIEGRVVLQNVP